MNFLSAQRLYDLLKLNLDTSLLPSLMLAWPLTARIEDVINISFPEIIDGIVFTIVINDSDIRLSNHRENSGYDTGVMERHLLDFLNKQCA